MPIEKYLGPFDKKGNIINKTKVLCKCDVCKNTWRSKVKQIKKKKSLICSTCNRYGKPRTSYSTMQKYPIIVTAKEDSVRCGITADTLVSVRCSECQNIYDIAFRSVKKYAKKVNRKDYWRCHSCAQRMRYGKPLLFSEDIPEKYTVDRLTLGDAGQITNSTLVYTHCEHCETPVQRIWGNISKHDFPTLCVQCKMEYLYTQDSFLENWRDGMDNRTDMKSSSGHLKLKELMVENDIDDFYSEQWIAKSIKVDEVNWKDKLVIEFFGSYWHADPRKHGASDVMFDDPRRGLMRAKDIWKHDKNRLDRIKSLGYEVVVVWEDDFYENQNSIIKEIKDIANKRGK